LGSLGMVKMNSISTEIKELLAVQKEEWELAAKNFASLANVQVHEFRFNGFTVKVQFNPGRIISSAAKVDKKSIKARLCFLCEENRPKEQKGVTFGDYSVLVNPYPIFPEHFTLPTFMHVPQRIKGNLNSMLELAEAMEGFVLFYNGPKCGASAPDHFHFQAGNVGFMPIDVEIEALKEKYGKKYHKNETEVWAIKDGLRNFIVVESEYKTVLSDAFDKIYREMEKMSDAREEPMMNILTLFKAGRWRTLIFPRVLHRPFQYFEDGEKNILVSPASVDMGGVIITPLEKDFKKITKEDIKDIFRQVLLPNDRFDDLIEKIKD